ncbi:MAG: hypothetical protein KGJ59_11505 [Bacteroidota bacterium]|nr:hypothetical protein [Bacteroidota bacterium]
MSPVFLFFAVFLQVSNVPPDSGKTCLAPYWGGILAGYSTDREVRQLYGDGVYFDSIGDCGSRFYTNPSKTVTMEVVLTNDCIVEEVEVRQGFHPPHQLAEGDQDKMVSDFLDHSHGLGNFYELMFGKTFTEVEETNGPPQHVDVDDGETRWIYESVCHCELSSGIAYRFKNGLVVAVEFWAESN